MSLYTYVPGRAELVDVMLDAVHLETHGQAISDPDHAFEFGLQRVLTGIEALVGERSR